MWDLAGGLYDERLYAGADGILAMYDLTVPETAQFALDIVTKHGNLPSVLCGNKADCKYKLRRDLIRRVCEMSSKTNYHYVQPILVLARMLTGDADLAFVDAPAVTPPTVRLDPAE